MKVPLKETLKLQELLFAEGISAQYVMDFIEESSFSKNEEGIFSLFDQIFSAHFLNWKMTEKYVEIFKLLIPFANNKFSQSFENSVFVFFNDICDKCSNYKKSVGMLISTLIHNEILPNNPSFNIFPHLKPNQLYAPKTLQNIICNDDINSFVSLTSQIDFDYDQKLVPHAYDFFCTQPLTIFEFSALYSSIKIFKYIHLNIGIAEHNSIAKYCIASGNNEMTLLCNQFGIDLSNCLEVAAKYHKNDLYDWIKSQNVIPDDDMLWEDIMAASIINNNFYTFLDTIEEGFSIDWATFGTPFECCLWPTHIEIVRYMMRIVDTPINGYGVSNRQPLYWAATKESGICLKLMLARKEAIIDKPDIIMAAIMNGYIENAKLLFDYDEKQISYENQQMINACYLAASKGCIEFVKYIYKSPYCSFDSSNKFVTPILIKVLENGYIDVFNFLVEFCNVDINKADSSGKTALYKAIEKKQFDVIKSIINNKKADINKHSKVVPYSPLHTVCNDESVDVLRYLLDLGAFDINAKTTDDFSSVLHISVINGSVEAVKLLLACKDLDINSVNKNGKTALSESVTSSFDCFQLILNDERVDVNAGKRDPISIAIDSRKFNVLELLIDQKDFIIEDNPTLPFLAQDNCIPIIEKLISRGLDPNMYDKEGKTLLHNAIHTKSIMMIKYLLSLPNIDINRKEKDTGYTPLHIAAIRGSIEIGRILLNNSNCNPNQDTVLERTALHLAILNKKSDFIREFLDYFDVNLPDKNGNCPIHLAVQVNSIDIVEALCESPKIILQKSNGMRKTALQLAKRYKFKEIEAYLSQKKKSSKCLK